MRRFQFRLDRLLAMRKHEEEQWEQRLAEATGQCRMLEGRIRSLLDERASRFRDRYSVLGMNAGPLVQHEHYLRRLDRQVRELRGELSQAETKRREMQEGYLEASKKRKVLDKLKERRARDYYKQQLMDEMKEVDDINNAAAVRRGVRREGETT